MYKNIICAIFTYILHSLALDGTHLIKCEGSGYVKYRAASTYSSRQYEPRGRYVSQHY
jgi:hypothetical protein